MWEHVHDGKKVYISDKEFCPICNSPLTIIEWKDTDELHICEIDRKCESCNRYEYIWAYGQSSIKIDGWIYPTFLEDNACMETKDFDLKELKFESIKKEIFVDYDARKHRMLIYIIDHTKEQIIPYCAENVFEAIDFILEKNLQYNIDRIGLYSIYGEMFPIYDSLIMHNINVIDRRDIYHWRMTLESHIRNRTYPIYYYEALYHYRLVSEKDYLEGVNE